MNDRPRSREDRLDPGGEMRRRAEGLAALARPPWSEYLRALGVSPADLVRARALLDEHEARFGGLDSDADVLATHGWLLFELSPHDAYRDAAALIRDGHVDDAEQRIVNAWNYHDCGLLRLATHRVDGLYVDFDADYDTDPGGLLIGQARAEIIEQAIECHRDGRYAAAINLALAQIDGIVADFSIPGMRSSRGNRTRISRERTWPTRPRLPGIRARSSRSQR